jgi:hypothetical protein
MLRSLLFRLPPSFAQNWLALAGLTLLSALSSCSGQGEESWPAAPGFNTEASEDKAVTLADQVMARQGGYTRWQQARYLAWTYYGAYHLWDKKLGIYRQEKDHRVILMSVVKPEGKVFIDGKRMTDPIATRELLEQSFMIWRFATDFLVLPFRLKDPGVTLRYGGTGLTMAHDTADILEMHYQGTGPTGNGRNQLWISRKDHLVTQWAFYTDSVSTTPAFVRDWLDYHPYNGLLFATQRNSDHDTLTVSHIAVLDTLPRELFFSARPVDKRDIAVWATRKK